MSGEMRRLAGAGTPDAHRAEGMDAHRARRGGGRAAHRHGEGAGDGVWGGGLGAAARVGVSVEAWTTGEGAAHGEG